MLKLAAIQSSEDLLISYYHEVYERQSESPLWPLPNRGRRFEESRDSGEKKKQ